MFCSNCGGEKTSRSKFCPHCGKPGTSKTNPVLMILTILMVLVASSALYFAGSKWLTFQDDRPSVNTEIQVEKASKPIIDKTDEPVTANSIKETINPGHGNTEREVADIIEDAQKKVYTIYSNNSQGSGFLINEYGDVLTNAHVVEGSTYALIKSHDGYESEGYVIGYSNEIDLAVIRVPELAGLTPFALEIEKKSELGDEVIALGSPHGYENTATLGNISGVDRTFTISPHVYENIYQISAPIAPGSSGGPLLDQQSEKVIGVNSARHGEEATIGFSIPMFKVMDLINGWVANPMSEEAINSLFYNSEGYYFYEDLYSNDFYFDGGYYSEDEEYFYYDAYTDTYYYYDPYSGDFYYYDEASGEFYYYEYDDNSYWDEYYYENEYDYEEDYYYEDEEYYEEDYYYEDDEYYEEDYYYEDEEYYEEDYYYEDDEYYEENYYYEDEEYYEEEYDYEGADINTEDELLEENLPEDELDEAI
ncbi:trypsin-like peptidase domain-containing protein [Jeotgalibacillus sp. R-1-5s-1]|uniref:trypsin-like peptidase domain-containing protein n=1 Tax=Jeotgalibacillus sp. R-1-5s-1 TaxID=2555897 RepID=UPI00106B01B2|nr:trypsin-like peptidase domain-containing protein [Jeotgalibacillus sp. R-1-5s-1]TFE00065.1 trypsin-like serine protease [Jeotgalibacillus sp. R-1-5s-1]